jgi:serine phosphatase RsbU (regulator of sigma subunit)
MQTDDKDHFLKNEILSLRRQAAINSQIGEFVLEIYELQEVGEVFDSLVKHLYELTIFDKTVYLSLSPETEELKVEYSQGFEYVEKPYFSFNIFENPDKDIISAIFNKKTIIIQNGFAQINELSFRLDIDNYVIVPLILHLNTEKTPQHEINDENSQKPFAKEREILKKTDNFSILGVFVFDFGKMDDLETDYNILISEKLIRLAGMTINNILILQSLRSASEKNKKELEQARAVQEKLLPEKLPCNNFLQSFAFYIPVEEVGGDYYDLFLLKDGVYAVFIADVSGHGVSAALVMSAAKILLKTIASASLTPAQTLRRINEMLVSHISANRFLTAFYAIIDTNSERMTYTCAGHCPILLFNKTTKDYQQFQSDGFFIGMFPELDLPNHEYHYKKDENRLLLYTDGVVDSQNKEKVQFGLIRLKTIIARTLEKPADEVVKEVMKSLQKFVGNSEIEDDSTLFIVDF